MRVLAPSLLVALLLVGCKRDADPQRQGSAAPPAVVAQGAGAREQGPAWYRGVIRAADGVEARFFLGVPAPGAPGQAVLKVGGHEIRAEATFDGKILKAPFPVHQTAVEATVGPDGNLAGTFSTSWRAWGASSMPFAATKVAAPVLRELGTVGPGGEPIDLKEARTVWRLAMSDSGVAKLLVEQAAPGELSGLLLLETGNIVYLAGNGRGEEVVLTGFDGTSPYRLELALAADRASARGRFFGGHRFDWRETLTAARGADFELAAKTRAERAGLKIELPEHRELAALEPGPIVVELGGSWCSTCRNIAPFLVELYREYRPRGLQMVTLLYEFSDDAAVDAKQAEAFKQSYGVTWPVIPIRGGLDDFAEILPSGLVDVNPDGFPITMFLAPDRSLVALHAGFPATAAAAEYRRVTAEFRANIEAILARKK
jgi:thiol-disulfide isomerase/thioredoxin